MDEVKKVLKKIQIRHLHAGQPNTELEKVISALSKNKKLEKRILLFEGNPYHGETLCGYSKYFVELGFGVDIVANIKMKKEKPFCRLHEEKVNIYYMTMSGAALQTFFMHTIIARYAFIFISSTIVCINGEVYSMPNIIEMTNVKNKTFYVEHDLLNIGIQYPSSFVNRRRVFTLIERISEDYHIPMCNPHYFGLTTKPSHPQGITKFVAIGFMHDGYKSHYNLLKEIKYCQKIAGNDFYVTLIGAGKIGDVLHKVDNVNFIGRVNFETMFQYIEQSNFLLFMLDPLNSAHERYLFNQVTGALQLALGFGVVPVLCQKYAKAFSLTSEMAVICDDSAAETGMSRAVLTTAEEYKLKQDALLAHARKTHSLSLSNIKRALEA